MFTGPSNTMANHPLHDTTSICWQLVLVDGRKAGKDLNVKVPELGAHSESDVNGPISSGSMRLRRRSNYGIDSAAADCKAFTSRGDSTDKGQRTITESRMRR